MVEFLKVRRFRDIVICLPYALCVFSFSQLSKEGITTNTSIEGDGQNRHDEDEKWLSRQLVLREMNEIDQVESMIRSLPLPVL
jgi:hypothetical protein